MKLFLKIALFTVVMPGTFAVLLPLVLVADARLRAGRHSAWRLAFSRSASSSICAPRGTSL